MAEHLGRHVWVEYYGISAGLLDDVHQIEDIMMEAAKAADATIVQVGFHHFSPLGVSGVVVIQESHLSIHTWPEYGYAAVDIFTCGDTVDPLAAHAYLQDQLKPTKAELQEVSRGAVETAYKQSVDLSPTLQPPIIVQRDNWFTTRQKTLATSLRLVGKRLHKRQSPQQLIEVYESEAYGRFLALDQQIAISERDEGYYHEMMVHIPMRNYPNAKRVCVLGGGDGGLVREVVKYGYLSEIEIVEWDSEVEGIVRKFFPSLTQAMEDKRVKRKLQSIERWFEQPGPLADLILVDFTIEATSVKWVAGLKANMHPTGRLMTGVPNPQLYPVEFKAVWKAYWEVFSKDKIWLGRIPVPTLPGGAQFVVYVGINPIELGENESKDLNGMNLRVYNTPMHRATFALPNEILEMLS